jgi:carbamoyltransferase
VIILGVHDGHNASAALLIDGKVIACASEERFTRIKNDLCHPVNAINFVLKASGVVPEQIDKVALATKRADPVRVKIKRESVFKIEDYIREMHDYWRPKLYENPQLDYLPFARRYGLDDNHSPYNLDFLNHTPKEKWSEVFNEQRIGLLVERLKIPKDKVGLVDHHTAHAYYAYMASPRDSSRKAAVVTADSWGDDCNATISIVESGRIKEIHRTAMCNLARIYRWMTLLLGMKPNEHEYKVMGLAPYAKDYIRDPAYKIFKETLVVDGLDFKWKQKPTDMYFYFRERFEGVRFDGIAGGVQLWLEEMLCQWITNILNHTGADVLYFSGGLSLNVKANKMVAELPIVRDLHIPPSGGDESLAMGAAWFLGTQLGETSTPLQDAYLGYEPSEEEARKAAEQFRDHPDYEVLDHRSVEQLADLLVEGKVLARCVGRMEFGARALGNRSILCDPSKPENLNLINQKIKFRDFWMPFTPSILQERANDYLVNPKRLEASYMTLAFDSTPRARKDIRAAIHPADFTVRPQVVTSELNPEYYALIKAFERKTGIGALLNTSLNLHGDPIVCNVADSIHTLINSGLDGVILPGLLILRRDRNTNAR